MALFPTNVSFRQVQTSVLFPSAVLPKYTIS